MAEIKTRQTPADVDAFLAAVDHPVRRADGQAVRALMERISGEPAHMWGPSIIGCGTYRYRTPGRQEGDLCRIGFSPRKPQLAFYLGGYPDYAADLARLGRHKHGKGCLYLSTLANVDMAVLAAIIAAAWQATAAA